MHSLQRILTNPTYRAVAWIFTSLNIPVATWVLFVPTIKNKLELDDGQLGLALFGFSAGLLVAIPPSSWLFEKLGLGRLTYAATICFALAMTLPVIAPSYGLLFASLVLCGMFASLMDIGMNSMISELESRDGVNIMSAAHGFFSIGGVIGAGIGSLLLDAFAGPFVHMACVAGFLIITNTLAARHYFGMKTKAVDREDEGGFKFSLIKPLLGFTILSVIFMGSEGAIEHWSKLYLLDIVKLESDKIAGFGYVAFSATMTLGRFLGDGISTRIGPYNTILGGAVLAGSGFGLVLTAFFWPAMIGFALVGLGFSVIVPELFRLAGKQRAVTAAEGISVVAGMGYVGLLAGPAVLGFLSDFSSLWLSFAALLGGTVVAFLVTLLLKLRRGAKGEGSRLNEVQDLPSDILDGPR